MLSPILVDYDPSNGSWNVFCIEAEKIVRAMAEDPFEVWELQPYAFQTLGHAMAFVQPQLERPLYQDEPGGMWHGDLKHGSPLGSTRVRIQQLVMVLDGHVVPSRRSA